MKNRLALVGTVAVLVGGAAVYSSAMKPGDEAPGGAPPAAMQPDGTAPDLTSYAIGYSLGERVRAGLAADGLTADFSVIRQGFRDALNDIEPAIDADLLEAELFRIQEELQARLIERELENNEAFRALAAEKLAAAESFLAENAKRPGVEIGARGAQWRVLHEGSGALPQGDDTVAVNYTGTLIDGTEFERADGRLVELDNAIPGVQTLLTQMRVGSKWRVFVPPALGYGVAGMPPAVGPNEVLVFEIELLEIVE